MTRLGVPVVVAVMQLAACSLFLDTNEFTDNKTADAGPTVLSRDGARDTSASQADARPEQQQGSDASGDGAQQRPPCTATFCDDFDTKGLGVDWSGLDQTGGPIALDQSTFLTPPFSLLVKPFVSGESPQAAKLFKNFPAASKIVVETSLKVDGTSAGGVVLLNIELAPIPVGFTQYIIGLSVVDGVYRLETVTTPLNAQEITIAGDFTQWHRVKLSADFKTKLAAVEIDGSLTGLALPETTSLGERVGFGATYARNQTAELGVRFDDVAITIEP